MSASILTAVLAICVPAQESATSLLGLERDGTEAWTDLRAAVQAEPERDTRFTLGGRVGYLRVKDADEGTWTGGIQARLYLAHGFVAVEGSIEFHQDEFADGDIVVTQYPVQVTGLVFPFARQDWPVQPYALAGAGWYYTRIDYDDALGLDEDTEHYFGVHVGAGGDLRLGERTFLNADFRWVFVDEPGIDNSDLDEEEWDFWQATGGINFRF